MKFFLYVLKSSKSGKIYVGQTNDLSRRLSEHNRKRSLFDNLNKPFEIIYTESYDTRKEAVNREKYFKSGVGRNDLKNNILAKSPVSSVG